MSAPKLSGAGITGALAAFDARPFFARALAYGARQGVLDPTRLRAIEADMAKGVVQIAGYFGTAYLRPNLESALTRMVTLMSLYLEDASGGDLHAAAISLRDKTLLSHSKGGSDMLKRLQAMPDSFVVLENAISPDSQRGYLDDRTGAHPITLAEYRAERAQRQSYTDTLELAVWIARKMGAARDEIDDAEALIRSAMLVLFAAPGEAKLPTRTQFVQLVALAKRGPAKSAGVKPAVIKPAVIKPAVIKTAPLKATKSAAPKTGTARYDEARFAAFFDGVPGRHRELAHVALASFIEHDLPLIRLAGNSADKLLHGETTRPYFVRESLDDDVVAYDRLVAREWHRVTRGEADDPQVLTTVCLLLATGLTPRPTLLLRDAKEVTRVFRSRGFDSQTVLDFIGQNAPEAQRRELQHFWSQELKPEAEERLADTDPNWPDAYLERALGYLRGVCRASWKARR